MENTKENLFKGKCPACGDWTNNLVEGDGRCLDCVNEEKHDNFLEELYNSKHGPINLN